jgi:hypothetical protein
VREGFVIDSNRFGLAIAGLVLAVVAAAAQTPFVPYYGKNQIRYDNFDWHIYTTDHFEIYYYPEVEPHLERVASYAESAYQFLSSELKHDLAARVPLVVFKTHSEFEQQNVIPGAAQEGVLAFAEPIQNRMLLPLDRPPDLLYQLIVHELTHVFEFEIIPPGLVRQQVPLWVYEGLSTYLEGPWSPLDLMIVRDAALADIIPRMSQFHGFGSGASPRLPYTLGRAAFEFMESRWGKEGIRSFLFALRKSLIGGGENVYEEAFSLSPEDFDREFDRYLKDRFKGFRDKQRPDEYGRDLAPDPQRTKFVTAFSIEPSPSGELLAAVTANRSDRELDIVLLSTLDGKVVRNLTAGFAQTHGFEHIAIPAGWNTVPWLSWSRDGDRLAYFARTGKGRSLILQNVASGRIERRIDMGSVDNPESPAFSPDGRLVAFSALRNAVADIYAVDLETGEIANLTRDEFANTAPAFSPDGSFVVYLARVTGYTKLFHVDPVTGEKRQLTFGTHDEAAARFLDPATLIFPSTALDPNVPIGPDLARDGQIYNLWTLGLRTGELRQYTDALGGTISPVVLGDGDERRIAFVSYYKGQHGVHTLALDEPVVTAASHDFGAPGPVIDFQAPLQHTLFADNPRRKGRFEKMQLDGRPSVGVALTSGGDLFGGTQISLTDVLGDQQFSLFVASVSRFRTAVVSYLNVSRRLQWAVQGFSQTQFFFGQTGGVFFDDVLSPFIDRNLALATRTVQGGSAFGIYPLDRFRRLEFSAGVVRFSEQFENPTLEEVSRDFQQQRFGQGLFRNGTFVPFGVAFVQETTVFREFGPLAGDTIRFGYEIAPSLGNSLSRQTADLDARYYRRLGGTALLALRGFRSWGESPDFLFFGGNSEMRGYEFLEFVGQNAVFGNAELRFPLIEAMLTPVGVMGGVRGVFFLNIGGAWFDNTGFTFSRSDPEVVRPVLGVQPTPQGTLEQVLGPPTPVSGFRLRDGRASYGLGLQTFALGLPIHFDWSWRTLFNRRWEDVLFASSGGSETFRRPRFNVWIGFDF